MGVLLQITQASKSYGDQILLDGAEATFHDNVKIGFIGRNGAGKSTLLKCILGEEELDRGDIIRSSNLKLGYLRQHDPFLPGESALDFLMRDSEQPDWKCGEVAGEFELKGSYLRGPIAKLSGGWQTRVKLAALLLHEPNLLLLDEPTNFLDIRTQILLEHFLKNHRSACLIVSHDRAFLNATCTHTLDLSRGKLTLFPGKVDAYLEFVKEQRERDMRANETIMSKRRHLEEFIAKNKARAATATLARSKSKQLERLELNEIDGNESTANIRPPKVEPRKGNALRCIHLSMGYPDRTIAEGIELEIEHGSRAAIVGDNGQGKTTFLRTLVDSLPPLSGEVKWGHGCNIGTYAQHVYTSLPEDRTVLEYLHSQAAPGKKDQEILGLAGALLFKGGAVNKRIAVLSGGERARLCLAGLLLSKHNVLILDEPGNHLDVDTIEALGDALVEYEGTVIFTSHDRHFMTKVATSVIEVRDGRVVNHSGRYQNYLDRVNQEIEDGERELASTRALLPREVRHAVVETSAGPRTEKMVRKEMKTIERQIAQFDEQKKTLTQQMNTTQDADELVKLEAELNEITSQLEEAENKWSELWAEAEGM
ncbi:MAG: ABC-F family ATP-binding cassette domain-containing protein [Planctomycetia bacterium]|nr:ABC-F family ATP-binding cassette domain-containing protein [Planctomycetia bacterium]